MHIFNHTELGVKSPQELATDWYCELHTINDRPCHHNCKIKAAYIFGVTYRPLSSWGRILKKFLEELEAQRPGVIAALISTGTMTVLNGNIPTTVAANEFTWEKLKQPSRIGNTGYYYDTMTTSKSAIKVLRQIVSVTGTEQNLVMYLRV